MRYVDDTLKLAIGSTAGTSLKDRLNTIHPTIKFTLELPDTDGFVPFLDLQIAIQNGHIHNRYYQKASKKDMFLHINSALPQSVKRNAISEELLRAKRLCSDTNSTDVALRSIRRKILKAVFQQQ